MGVETASLRSFLILISLLFVSSVVCSLEASQLALLINDADPYSTEIGEYYRIARSIPDENIIHLNFNKSADARTISTEDFNVLKQKVDTILNATNIQAIAISWVYPSMVNYGAGQSITSAFAYGVQPETASSCSTLSYTNPYFNVNSSLPWTDKQIRITMMLGGFNTSEAKALIDRGVKSDGTYPIGDTYVLQTSDPARSVRGFVQNTTGQYINITVVKTDSLTNTNNCIYYCAGTAWVDNLQTNRFPPGAMGDHLTSYGGVIPSGNGQMCLLYWIQNGMTGTYGTVTEPCNYSGKFPDPLIVTKWYASGDTLIETYWKSVYWPHQGLFVGEPLARPYAPPRVDEISSSPRIAIASALVVALLACM